MSRKKTRLEKFREGDTGKIGAKKLAAQLAAEPKCQKGLVCPAHLQGDGAALFAFFAEQLEQSGLDARPDSQALAVASESLARAWKAGRMLRRQGEVRTVPILGKDRRVVGHRQTRNKWFGVLIESQRMFDRVARQFGLTGPTSRSGLEASRSYSNALEQRNPSLFELLATPRQPKALLPEQIEWQAKQAKAKEPPPEPVQ